MKAELVLASFDAAAEAGRPYRVSHGEAAAIRALVAERDELRRSVQILEGTVERVVPERDKYREWAATFIALWSATYAQRHGAPSTSHVVAEHYDVMAECGCRMDDFVRWEP